MEKTGNSQCQQPRGLKKWWKNAGLVEHPGCEGMGTQLLLLFIFPPTCFAHDSHSATLCRIESNRKSNAAYLSCRGFLLFKPPSLWLFWDTGDDCQQDNRCGSRSRGQGGNRACYPGTRVRPWSWSLFLSYQGSSGIPLLHRQQPCHEKRKTYVWLFTMENKEETDQETRGKLKFHLLKWNCKEAPAWKAKPRPR